MTLIVALDKPQSLGLVDTLCGVASGFKIGVPLLLDVGLEGLRRARSRCSDALWVADMKLADIGHVMALTARRLAGLVDAVIAHGFVGLESALDILAEECRRMGMKLVVIASMSHPGSRIYDKVLEDVLEVIEAVKPWGVVAPATRPNIIRRVRRRLGCSVAILSPGIGAQGASPGDAICAGADYEIVGRAITSSENPLQAARNILEQQRRCRRACREPQQT